MEDVYTEENKITAITKFTTMETTNCQLPTLCITGRIGKLGQHLHIIQTAYTHSNSTTKKGTFQWHVIFTKTSQEELLPFLRDALSWLTRTAMTKDVRDIKIRVNQLMETQTQQQEALLHVISILNVTRHAT